MAFPFPQCTPGVRVALLVLTVVCLPAVVPVSSAQHLSASVRHFDEGNARYGRGDYRGAVESYERALEAGYVSGAVLFNLGNAHYRLDEIGQAVRFYEKAAEWMPDSPELRHNMSLVRARTTDSFSRVPVPFWVSLWRSFVHAFGSGVPFLVGFLFYVVAGAMLVLRLRGSGDAWLRRGFAVASVTAVVLLGSGLAASVEEQTVRRAVVLASEVSLYEAPGRSPAGIDIHEGLVIDVLSENEGWIEVRIPNGVTGWIPGESLGAI